MYEKRIHSSTRRGFIIQGLIFLLSISSYGFKAKEKKERCLLCSKYIVPQLAVDMVLKDKNTKVRTCCPMCGSAIEGRFHDKGIKIESATGSDYFTGEKINYLTGHFVFDSKHIECCVPAIYIFKKKEDAERFISQNGGHYMTHDELLSTKVRKELEEGLKKKGF
jgi:hypothetical protein